MVEGNYINMMNRILDMIEEIERELNWYEKLPVLHVTQSQELKELTIKYNTIKEIMGAN